MAIDSYQGRRIDTSKPVEVYRNIRRAAYSIRQEGRVVGHTSKIVLEDVTFVIHEAGRKKVIKTGQKNVHAWVKGRIPVRGLGVCKPPRWARYNPKETKTFVDRESGKSLTWARYVILEDRGILYG